MKLQSFFSEAAAFFTEARYSTAATWLQTVLLGVTLIYTGAQLSQLIEQNKGPKREKFYSFQKDYKEHLADRIERVHDAVGAAGDSAPGRKHEHGGSGRRHGTA